MLHGLASYYGPGFHGRETASGRIFNQAEMVAAHRTLPLGTLVRVTNLKNGRAVTLRVIDRGPYGRNHRRGTIIDVSKGAAQRLQFLRLRVLQSDPDKGVGCVAIGVNLADRNVGELFPMLIDDAGDEHA